MMNGHSTRVLIAGATGVIGSRLCRLLRDDGWSVIGTTRSRERAARLLRMGVTPQVVDVFDAPALCEVLQSARPTVVIHQLTDLPAALEPTKMAAARVRNARLREVGTGNLVAAAVAAGVERVIAQSIAFAYAPGPMPHREEAPLLVDDPHFGLSARAVASLERQVLAGPFTGIVLRYGRLYGPGTGFDTPPDGAPVHADAAAHAARLALVRGDAGVYNIAEADGTVCSRKAADALGWDAGFRMTQGPSPPRAGARH